MLCMLLCSGVGIMHYPQGPSRSLLRAPIASSMGVHAASRMLQLHPDAACMLKLCGHSTSWCANHSARTTQVRGCAGLGQVKVGDYAEVVPADDEKKVSGPDYRYVLQITEMLEDTKVRYVWYMCRATSCISCLPL